MLARIVTVPTVWHWCLLGALPGLLRFGLLLFGFRETIQAEPRIALSLIHVPLALMLEAAYLAWLYRRLRRGMVESRSSSGDGARVVGSGPWRDATVWIPALSFLFLTWLLPAFVVSDLGLALLNVPVFLLALASLAWWAGRQTSPATVPLRRRLVQAAPLLGLAVYLCLTASHVGSRALVATLPEEWQFALHSERNYLRMLDFAYPERLGAIARRGSEELAVMSAVMRAYTSGPVLGRGYFASEVSPHLRATALREHLPAVLLAAEWGLFGVIGVVLVYLAAVAAAFACAPWRRTNSQSSFPRTLSFVAGLTLAVPSLYMILANYRLTLFTGKNAYLLGLDSSADVLEGALLVLIFAFGAMRSRSPRPTVEARGHN